MPKTEDNNTAIQIKNSANSETVNNTNGPSNTSILIIGNKFYDGDFHLAIVGLAENILPVYIVDNIHQNGNRNYSLINTSGTVRNNIIESESNFYPKLSYSMYLINSSPDFLNNIIISQNVNYLIRVNSSPNLAPVITNDGQVIWTGGLNKLSSSNYNNLYLNDNTTPSFVTLKYGRNSFSVKDEPEVLHINGYLNSYETEYPAMYNCWRILDGSGIAPKYSLFNNNNEPITLILEQNSDCQETFGNVVDRIITEKGNGIIDTILITQSNYQSNNTDLAIYSTGLKNQKLNNFTASISNFKNLINEYPYSTYILKTLYNLYECYVSVDTNRSQNSRNIIFSDLKDFLEQKIQQYDTNISFVNTAFDFYLKCEIKKKNYQQAMNGYQLIAENSPSALERLMASINYIDVEGLQQGNSGGNKDESDNSYELTQNLKGKPIKSILLDSYKKSNQQIKQKEKEDIKNSNDITKTKADLNKKHSSENLLKNRAVENISISSSLTKKERGERIQKDLILLTSRGEVSEKSVKKTTNVTSIYDLSQNYPNPFNPITNIKYQIPKTGLVTLKIYDMLGREIKTLVNEVKNPGSYMVSFNGSEFASGVYFYRIQAGDFIQVKKMLMIK